MKEYYVCRYDRPSSIYPYICWVGGPIRVHLVVRGRVNAIMEVHISEWRHGVWLWGFEMVVWGRMCRGQKSFFSDKWDLYWFGGSKPKFDDGLDAWPKGYRWRSKESTIFYALGLDWDWEEWPINNPYSGHISMVKKHTVRNNSVVKCFCRI